MMNRHSNSFWESLKSRKTKQKMCTTADEFPNIFILKKNHDEKNAQCKQGWFSGHFSAKIAALRVYLPYSFK